MEVELLQFCPLTCLFIQKPGMDEENNLTLPPYKYQVCLRDEFIADQVGF